MPISSTAMNAANASNDVTEMMLSTTPLNPDAPEFVPRSMLNASEDIVVQDVVADWPGQSGDHDADRWLDWPDLHTD